MGFKPHKHQHRILSLVGSTTSRWCSLWDMARTVDSTALDPGMPPDALDLPGAKGKALLLTPAFFRPPLRSAGVCPVISSPASASYCACEHHEPSGVMHLSPKGSTPTGAIGDEAAHEKRNQDSRLCLALRHYGMMVLFI